MLKYLNDSESSSLRTEPKNNDREKNANTQGIVKKTKVVNNNRNKNQLKIGKNNNNNTKVEINNNHKGANKIYNKKIDNTGMERLNTINTVNIYAINFKQKFIKLL